MASLAARDLENLINAHQNTAASKPLNQGARGLQPKTPGKTSFQTPFKGRQHDENTVLPGKNAGGKPQMMLATPAPMTTRGALGPKTTNAKVKTPGLALTQKPNVVVVPRSGNRSPHLRRINNVPKLQIANDVDATTAPTEDQAPSSPEIEYMPPRSVPLPDFEDDYLEGVDLSFLDTFQTRPIIQGIANEWLSRPVDATGTLTRGEVEKKKRDEIDGIHEARLEAEIVRSSESVLLSCVCAEECEGDCREWAPQLAAAEAKYQQTMAGLLLPHERQEKERAEREVARKETTTRPSRPHTRTDSRAPSRVERSKGPSDAAARRAASALAMRDEREAAPAKGKHDRAKSVAAKSRDYPKPWLAGSKAAEGYAGRHAAGVAASRTNLGFRKGRTASADLKSAMMPPGTARPHKTETQVLREMWAEIEEREAEEDGVDLQAERKALDAEAAEDFELRFD